MNWLQYAALGLTTWLALGVACALPLGAFISLRRNVRATPCPGERDAHDALRDGGEGGEFRTIHNEGINP